MDDNVKMYKSKGKRSLFPINFVGHDVVEVITAHESVFVEIGLWENVVDFFLAKLFA